MFAFSAQGRWEKPPLPAWHENISKRQVKAPKVYISDSGLLHELLNLRAPEDLESHFKLGASWEGFVIKELIQRLNVKPEECFFWATHAGADLDLLIVRGRMKLGFEIKRTSAPGKTRSMYQAFKDLNLQRLDVIHSGDQTFMLSDSIRALSFTRIFQDIPPLDYKRGEEKVGD